MKRCLALLLLAFGMLGLNAAAQTIGTVLTNSPDDVILLNEPYGVAVVLDKFYITDGVNDRVVRYDASAGERSELAAGLFDPRGIVAARGGLVVSDAGNNAIKFVSLTGVVTLLAGSNKDSQSGGANLTDGPGTSARFNAPAGLAVDSAGNIYIADQLNNAIRKLDGNNVVSTVAAGLYKPAAVAYDEAGQRLFIADTENHSIRLIANVTPASTAFAAPVLVAGSGSSFQYGSADSGTGTAARFNKPSGLLWVGGKIGLLVSDTGNALIRKVDGASYAVSTYANSAKAGLVKPMGMALDADGNVLVVDLGKNALLTIQIAQVLPPVSEPRIGVGIITTNLFSEFVWAFQPVTNATYFNYTNVVIDAEDGSVVHYEVANGAADLPDPTIASQTITPFIRNGFYSHTAGVNELEDAGLNLLKSSGLRDYTNIVIKAFCTADGRKPSKVVSARVTFKTANPSIIGNNLAAFTVECATAGASMHYTTNSTNPTEFDPIVLPGESPVIFNGSSDVDFRVKAFRASFEPSGVVQRLFRFADLQTSVIGVLKTNYNAGIGSTILVPVQVKLAPGETMRSLQFRVEVSPNDAGQPAILPQFRPMDLTTNDFIKLIGVGANNQVARGSYTTYLDGKIRGLAISYLATNANFSAADFSTVALLAIPIPPDATDGATYRLEILNASATADAMQTPIVMKPLGASKVTIASISYVVGDSAVASFYNAGDFGNGNLNNNDVNNAFYASVGVRTPYSFSDVFDAMDAFPLDTSAAVGGDGQIRFLDWQIILIRSLRLDTNNWKRNWSAGGRRVPATTALNSVPATPAEVTLVDASRPIWLRQAVLFAQPVENAQPGQAVKVPVYLKVRDGYQISGLQFRTVVEPQGAAPALGAPALFVASSAIAKPTYNFPGLASELPINQTVSAWSLVQNGFASALRGVTLMGYVEFSLPSAALAGQQYVVRFLSADGAPDLNTQYDLETLPGIVWVGTAAQKPAEQISDEYKLKFFGSLSSIWAAASADADGDGIANLQEYLAGKNPTKLRLHRLNQEWLDNLRAKGFNLRWFAKQGKRYSIERSTSLKGGSWTSVGEMTGDNSVREVLDNDSAAGAARFYRIIEMPQ